MYSLIAAIVPIAIGVSFNPMILIGAIAISTTGGAHRIGRAYILGWMTSVTIVSMLGILIYAFFLNLGPYTGVLLGLIQLAIGVYLLWLAWKHWGNRPTDEHPARVPKWIKTIEQLKPRGAFKLSLTLGLLNVKNATIIILASAIIVTNANGPWAALTAFAIFVILSAFAASLPFLALWATKNTARKNLLRMKNWLMDYEWLIMMIVLTVIGFTTLGNGIDILFNDYLPQVSL